MAGVPRSASATSYYVSPAGNNGANGLSPATAWASINRGDQLGILTPGDTVHVLAGTYPLSASALLSSSGSASNPIVYQGSGFESCVLDGQGAALALVDMQGNHCEVRDIKLQNGSGDGMVVTGDSNAVIGAYVQFVGTIGIRIAGNGNLVQRCVVTNVMDGVRMSSGADYNRVLGNTVHNASSVGINIWTNINTTRVFNNIIHTANYGIWAKAENVCAFNDIWSSPRPYNGGAFDSAGGLSVDPLFANPASGDFHLLSTSPCIDRGLDIGYSFSGVAPDLGALEFGGSHHYYVSPSGNDSLSGRTRDSAWATIDNGDRLGLIVPGDTVNVLPGVYTRSTSVALTASGTAAYPLVYRRLGRAQAVIDLNGAATNGIVQNGDWVELHGLTVTRTGDHGVESNGDQCLVEGCRIIGAGKIGLRVQGDYGTFVRNIIYLAGDRGIRHEDAGRLGGLYYHNVVYQGAHHGIDLGGQVKTARLFNNIVAGNAENGIKGPAENILGFNNVWGNAAGDYNGLSDSAGGISYPPQFVDPALGRFDLGAGAFEINAGLDLGDPFSGHVSGPAPEIGAFEKYNAYFAGNWGDDLADGWSVASAWASIGNGDTLLRPGDTVYVLPGVYDDSVVIHDGGAASNDLIVFQGQPGLCTLDGSGRTSAVRLLAPFVRWAGIDVTNAQDANLRLARGGCHIEDCRITKAGHYGVRGDSTCHLAGNVVAENGDGGAYVASGIGAGITNNTFYSNGHFGYYTLGSGDALVNNIFAGHDSAAVRADSTATLVYSAFHNNSLTTSGGVVVGLGSKLSDPLLVAPDSGDFRLQSPSPAIDAGTDVGRPYRGGAPDMGAYETGVLASLFLVPTYDSLFADSSYPFAVIALDSSGAPAGYGTLTWSHTFPTGSISQSGVFTPQLVGSGQIVALSSANGLADTTATMRVVPGALFAMVLSPQRDTLSADSTRQFLASGTDQRGNPVPDVGTLFWSVIGGIGQIDSTGLFSAKRTGRGVIRAQSSLGPVGQTDSIVVVPGGLSWLDVLPSANSVIADSSYQFAALGYDADSNLALDLTDSVTWTTDDSTGSITSGGLYTAGRDASPPVRFVHAQAGSLRDSAAVTILLAGQLAYVRIELTDGTPFGDTTLTTDVDTTRLWCRGYSSGDSLIGDVSVAWTVIGADSVGSLAPSTGSTTQLSLRRPGTGRLVARYSGSIADTSGVIICLAGLPALLQITPDSATVVADDTLIFTAASFDLDGNPSEPAVTVTWSVAGSIGSVDDSGRFVPAWTGSGAVIATGAGLSDTASPVVVVPGPIATLAVAPDSVILSADQTQQFAATGYDVRGNTTQAGQISWQLTAPLGTIDSAGLFDAAQVGVARVVAKSALGPVDTSGLLRVVAGRLVTLAVSPDSVQIAAGDTLRFSASGWDSDGNPAAVAPIAWSALGGIGNINSTGLFEAYTVGVGRVVATNTIVGVTDTNDAVVVTLGSLRHLRIVPDTAVAKVGDTVHFDVLGFDAQFNPAPTGTIDWGVVGSIGSISASGTFTASSSGIGAVTARSSSTGIVDTSGNIYVEALTVSAMAIGNVALRPGGAVEAILAFHVANPYFRDKQVQRLTVHEVGRGAGTPAERLGNLDSLFLYLDVDRDLQLSVADTLIARSDVTTSQIVLGFSPVTVAGGDGQDFLVAVLPAQYARDGDSLDLRFNAAVDLETSDGTTVSGGLINSFGYGVIDGMTEAQIGRSSVGVDSISPGPEVALLAILDLPRNGYQVDTLSGLSLSRDGSAGPADFDSLILYRDDGDGMWGGAAGEVRVGRLVYTGNRWSVTGIATSLNSPTTRFFVGARLAQYATNNAVIHFNIPLYGVEVASGNDGPLDMAAHLPDAMVIQTAEALVVTSASIPAHNVAPGQLSGPLLGLQLTNSSAAAVGVDSLRIRLVATDPDGASQSQLNSQIDSLLVYLNRDGNHAAIGPADSLLSSAPLANGVALLDVAGLVVAGVGGQSGLTLAAAVSASNAKDANTINLRLADSTDLFLATSLNVAGSFPLQNPASFVIDAFPAARMTVASLNAATFFGGQTRRAALQVTVPANGYAPDTLRSLYLRNAGNLIDAHLVVTPKLWHDRTGNGLTADDSLLATFDYSAPFWETNNLKTTPVGSTGLALVVTVDVSDVSFDGGTLAFEIPVGGVEYRSGAIGPDDVAVTSPQFHLVLPSNRVTAISVPAATTFVAPGAANQLLFTLALYNGYVGQVKTLESIQLTNSSRTRSTSSFADLEIGQVSLFLDANRDRTLGSDSLIATGLVVDGHLRLSGLQTQLPPESLSYLFVVLDLPTYAIDADSLALSIASATDFSFAEAVVVNGDLPLSSGSYLVVDGSVREQYEVFPVLGRTLVPGDTSVTVLAFRPAVNGDRVDTLRSITVSNTLTADSSDLSRLVLWQDENGDLLWQPTDPQVGTFAFNGGAWTLSGLSLPVSGVPPALFVLADVATLATADAAFEASLSAGACQYASGNDGPNDGSLVSGQTFTVSNSGLRIATANPVGRRSVGQPVAVRATVTNILGASMDSVLGTIRVLGDSSSVRFDSAFAGPVSLAPSQSVDFVWHYTAAAAGTVYWDLQAQAPSVPDSSAKIRTQPVIIQSPPGDVTVKLVNSIPAAVTRGQRNIFPLSLTYSHPSATPTSASLQLDSLELAIQDEAGLPQPADHVFSRMVLTSGFQTVATITSVPAQASLWLRFSQPVTVDPGLSVSYSLLLDIDSQAVATSFALAVQTAASVPLVDENTSVTVPISAAVAFPLSTASCRIDNPSSQMAIAYQSLSTGAANLGQAGFDVLRLYVRHPGTSGNSQIQLSGLRLSCVDSLGADLALGGLFDQIRLTRGPTVIGQLSSTGLSTTEADLSLSLPITLSPNQLDSLDVEVAVSPFSVERGFRMLIRDSTEFVIRDLSSGSPLSAGSDTLLATAIVFPITSDWTVLQNPAAPSRLCLTSRLPASIVRGIDALHLIDLTFSQPAGPADASVRIHQVKVRVSDSLGNQLDPRELFNRMGYASDGGPVQYQNFVDVQAGNAVFRFTESGLRLDPGESIALALVADIESDVLYDHFGLEITAEPDLQVYDATDTTRHPGVVPAACALSFPFATGFTQIFLPAGRPLFAAQPAAMHLTRPGQGGVELFRATLDYRSPSAQAQVALGAVHALLLRRTADGLQSASPASVFAAVHLYLDSTRVATDSVLSSDSVNLLLPADFQISTGDQVRLEVRTDIAPAAPLGNYVLRFADSSCLELTDRNLAATVYAQSAGPYPILSSDLAIAASTLESSFDNFPNPFNPSRDEFTTFRFNLPANAYVDLELYTITGAHVRNVLSNEFRAAGSYSVDVWTGSNQSGQAVVPGTYFARITARFVAGSTEMFRRKVAVLR